MADELLFTTGDPEAIDRSMRASSVGKRTGNALYVHESALTRVRPLIRVYEGCARAYIGTVEGSNIIKLARDEPQISYLTYPSFEADPHPALDSTVTVHLRDLRVRSIDFASSANPPILHRKEQFVAPDHPLREKFARLTKQEERFGLFEHPQTIGRREGWEAALAEKGVELRGHRVVRT